MKINKPSKPVLPPVKMTGKKIELMPKIQLFKKTSVK